MSGKTLWQPSYGLVAQLSHLGWGAFIALAGSLWWGEPWGCVAVALWAALKEFVGDVFVIEGDTWKSGAVDFLFYLLGGGLGWLAWRLGVNR